MRILSHIFLLSLLLIGNSCEKKNDNNDKLPPLTFEGKNTIGCKINGEPWVPQGIFAPGVVNYPTSGGYYVSPFYPNVHILIKTNDRGGEIELFCRNYSGSRFISPGKYYFSKKTQAVNGYYEKHSYGLYYSNSKEYITDSLHNGWIDILKSDSINKIISGKFEFDAYNITDGKTYKITEGRFDYKTH